MAESVPNPAADPRQRSVHYSAELQGEFPNHSAATVQEAVERALTEMSGSPPHEILQRARRLLSAGEGA